MRNVIEASDIRRPEMPGLLADVRLIVVNGILKGVSTFNALQRADERRKAIFLEAFPELRTTLHNLEDHPLLRGCIAVFDLEPTTHSSVLLERAEAFHALFDTDEHLLAITGALLAIGDYSRRAPRWAGYSF